MTPGGERCEAVADAKTRLRGELLAARRALSPEQLGVARADVVRVLMAGLLASDRVVAGYEPLRTEPGSTALLSALAASGRDVLVPVTLPDRDLSWVRWHPDPAVARPDLGPDALGRADLVVVPALAVARADGARLGRGGGSYDRALRRVRGRTVALLHRGELFETVPVDVHDLPVDAAVTPDGWTTVGPG